MSDAPIARPRQAGGAILTVVLAGRCPGGCLLRIPGLPFLSRERGARRRGRCQGRHQRRNGRASLNPYKLTKDPAEVARQLQASFGIAPPEGYVGAFGLNVEMLGQKHMQLVALIPQDARPSDIFEGGRNEIRFNPGASTIFLAAQFNRSDRDEMRDAIATMVAGDGQSEPLKEVYIEAGGRKVAAYRGAVQSYGARKTVVFVFLDDGRLFHAAGPAGSFDERPSSAR